MTSQLNERLLTWDIRKGDDVVVIGGYQGATCMAILERYPDCNLYTWEPQKVMYEVLRKRLEPWPDAHAYNYGLGIENGSFPMIKTGSDFCSFLLAPGRVADAVCEMREFGEEMDRLDIEEIAWLHLNIESYEYLLLPHLIRTGWMEKIGQLVIAMHRRLDFDEEMPTLEDISLAIERTHRLWWQQRQFIAWSQPGRKMPRWLE